MVFNKNVERKQIEKFENDNLEKISGSAMFVFLKNELTKKNLSYKIEVQHSEINIKKYHSELTINIFNEDGYRVSEYDERFVFVLSYNKECFSVYGDSSFFFVKNGRIGESCVGVQPYSSSILKCQFDALSGRYVQFVFDILL